MGFKMDMRPTITKFKKFRRELPEACEEAADRSTDKLLVDSKFQVPKKSGALVGTAHKETIKDTGWSRTKSVKFGQPGEGEGIIDYAAAVHEILKAKHAPPTKAKFVEDPLVQGIPTYRRYTVTAAKRAVRRAFR
jgi:hypothetical protein